MLIPRKCIEKCLAGRKHLINVSHCSARKLGRDILWGCQHASIAGSSCFYNGALSQSVHITNVKLDYKVIYMHFLNQNIKY